MPIIIDRPAILLHNTGTQTISVSEVPNGIPTEFPCPYCGVILYSQADLGAHIQQYHPEKVPWYEEKYYGVPVWIYVGTSVGLALIIALARR